MKKTILCIISVLCYTLCIAQNIDDERLQQDWYKLLDYVCCKYTNEYINQYITHKNIKAGDNPQKRIGVNDSTGYMDTIKPELDKVTIDNPLKKIELKELITKGLWPTKGGEFVEDFYNSRNKNIKSIDSLLSLSTFNQEDTQQWLKKTQEKLKNELTLHYKLEKNTATTQNTVALQNTNKNTAIETKGGSQPKPKSEKKYMPLRYHILLMVIVVLILLWYHFRLKNIDKKCDKLTLFNETIDKPINKRIKEYLNQGGTQLYQKKEALSDSEIEAIATLVYNKIKNQQGNAFGNAINNKPQQESFPQHQQDMRHPQVAQSQPPRNEEYVYLKNFKEGKLRVVDNQSDAQYRIVLTKNQNEAEIDFIGNMESAIATPDATFGDICDIIHQSDSNSKQCVLSKKPRVQKQEDGRWKVISKGEVMFS